jgi:cation diffusion facilitator CzcD-associated flavoprotein CzcO
VWTNSTIVPKPVFDSVSKTWTVRVNRDGNVVQLHPAHIVIAAGTLGAPNIPKIANKDLFKGETLHANKYRGGKNYTSLSSAPATRPPIFVKTSPSAALAP